MRNITLFIATIAITISNPSEAQVQSIHFDEEIPRGSGAPANVQCGIDINNNVVSFPWYIPPAARSAGNTIPTTTCGSFTLIFEDVVNNTGQGYAGSQGAQMQAVACSVFQYISDVFLISGNPEVIFTQAYSNPQSGGLASGASIYNNTNTSGFINCYMQEHIFTGFDPDPSLPDGYINTNVAYPYNFNLTSGSTGQGEFDFYTILLHEALHTMGFASAIDQNGNSQINGAYTRFDSWLCNSSGLNLINASGTGYQTSISDITSGGVICNNTGASEIHPVYSPPLYSGGSSLGHFDIQRPLRCDEYHYVMHPSISYGIERRKITMAELELMCDIGYSCNQTILGYDHCARVYPRPVSDNISLPINQIYNQDVASTDNDSPDNDPISIDPNYAPVVYGPQSGLLSIVGNNIVYTPPFNFIGNVTILYSIYDGTQNDAYIDTYNPACLTLTYFANSCPDDACNLLCNGTFEDRENPNCQPYSASNPQNYTTSSYNNVMSSWYSYRGTADVITRDPCAIIPNYSATVPTFSFEIPNSYFVSDVQGGVDTYAPNSYNGNPNNTYTHMAVNNSQANGPAWEGVYNRLPIPMTPLQSYTLSFYVYIHNAPSSVSSAPNQNSGDLHVGFCFSANTLNNTPASGPPTTYDYDLSSAPEFQNIPVDVWYPISYTFTAPSNAGNLNYFAIESAPLTVADAWQFRFIDDFQLREDSPNLTVTKSASVLTAVPGQTFTYDITVCNNGPNAATGVTVTDYFPPGINYQSGLNLAPNDHTIPYIPVLGCETVTVTVEVDPNIDPQNAIINNCAIVTSGGAACQNSINTNNCVNVVVPYSDIAVTKSVDATWVTNGSIVTYTIGVVNLGPHVCPLVVVAEALPAGLSLIGYSLSDPNSSWNGSQFIITGMTVNQPVYLQVTALVTANNTDASCLTIYNCTSVVSSTNPDPDQSNNQACIPIFVEGAAPIISTNAATLCNTSTKVYSVTNPGSDPNTYFLWTLSCGTIISGQGSPSIQADFSNCTGDITITVSLSNSFTNCSTSATFIEPGCCFISNPTQYDILVDGTAINDIFDLYNAYPSAFTSGAPNFVYNNPWGTLYINGTFTIPAGVSSLTFAIGSEIRMATNAKIDVTTPSAFTMTISSSHIASGCGGMWDGIYLSGSNKSIIINGTSSQATFIEDAMNAVVSSGNANFSIENTVFNKNYIGVKVIGTGQNHPGMIRNTIFTCRTFSTYANVNTTALRVPLPGLYQVKELTVGSNAPATLLTNTLNATRSYAGVYLDKVGNSTVNPNTNQITSWTSITIGFGGTTQTGQLNVFDNLDFGIYARNSNVNVKNSHFQDLTGPTTVVKGQGNSLGIGVYGENDNFNLSKKIVIGLNNSRNYFYDCNRGIDLNGFYETRITNNYFHSNQVYTPVANAPALIGNYAVFVKSGRYVNNEIDNNSIANWSNGIVFLSEYIPLGGGQYFRRQGDVHIHDNEIASVIVGPYLTQYVTTAIIAHSLSVYCNICDDYSFGTVLIENNNIHEVFNGVFIQGWNNHPRVLDNDIWLTYRPNFGSFVFAQFGIRAISNGEPFIYRNHIYGNTVTGNTTGKTELRGIFCTQNFTPIIRCNDMTDVGQCMVFDGDNIGIVWDNEMFAATDGLVLINNGKIGPQGGAPGTMASENKWWGPFAVGGADTRVDNTSSAINSPLQVALGYPTEPAVNAGLVGSAYLFPNTIIQATTASNRNCNTPQIAPIGGGHDLAVQLRKTVQDSIPIGGFVQEARWMSKQHAYAILRSDTSLMMNEPVLQLFYSNAPSTGIGKVASTDEQLATTNIAGAYSVNQSIVPIVLPEQNYQLVNSIYFDFLAGYNLDQFQIQTLESVASQCPAQGGVAVYRARSMLEVINDQVLTWSDSCNSQTSLRYSETNDSIQSNSINLYPNPNDGTMILSYTGPENETGQFNIYDLYGNLVFTEALEAGTENKKISVLQLSSGIYFYRVQFGDQTIQSDKIVIQK